VSVHDSSATADVPEMPAPRARECTAHSIGCGLALLLGPLGLLAAVALFVAASVNPGFALRGGLNTVAPGEARVVPSRTKISTRVRDHETAAPEVNGAYGNPIEPAAVVVAARRQIVDGAGGMVEAALARIAVGVPPTPFRQCGKGIVEPDEERKAAMVSNLMVVLCGDRAPQPVLNTGTLCR
jgi:hypothetical protein